MLVIYFETQFLGWLTPIEYVPECDYTARYFWYFIFGAVLVALTVVDYWAFYFNPLQKNVFLDQAKIERKPISSRPASTSLMSDTQDILLTSRDDDHFNTALSAGRDSNMKSDRSRLAIDKLQFMNM